MELYGKNFIGRIVSGRGARTFQAFSPVQGKVLEPDFYEATDAEVEAALQSAEAAFERYRTSSPGQRASFLNRMADEILALGEELIERASAETALPAARLTAERTRTVNQIRMFAQVLTEGSWVEARIDTAQPHRQPVPKPDLRRMLIPLGPVAVFGASNFPLAFSVAGGDTVSALAAGNPVVVKAHPAHPGTSELVARAILRAVETCDLADGIFSMLQGVSAGVGSRLVEHRLTRAVAFTGSLRAGRALFDKAAARPQPIPFYAEMGSVNPVFVLPSVVKENADGFAESLCQSMTLGVGQFCTNPGVVVGLSGESFDRLTGEMGKRISRTPPGSMLYPALRQAYEERIEELGHTSGVEIVSQSAAPPDAGKNQAKAVILKTDAQIFLGDRRLREEVFGPSSLMVACGRAGELEEIARCLEGQLTASIHGHEEELLQHRALIAILERKVGRLIFNGFPTGVEVCPSVHHGGPYPATTEVRSTSVGTAAIQRFARPICYQNFPKSALPTELQDQNHRKIWRLVNNEFTKGNVTTSTRRPSPCP